METALKAARNLFPVKAPGDDDMGKLTIVEWLSPSSTI
jgi:hypothetical protein